MNLKKILLAGAFLLSTSLTFSQNKLKFDVYSNWPLGIKLNTSSLKASQNQMDFSFLLGIYSMEFKKLTDSTYREIVSNNFLWITKKEVFDYLLKDSHYTFVKYSAVGEKSREEKEALEGRVFDKKYKTPLELVEDFKNGRINDSIHFIINGLPYSVKVEKKEDFNKMIYSCNLDVKREPGDMIIAPKPIILEAIKKDGKYIPDRFFTTLVDVRGEEEKEIFIEGILRKED